MKKAFLGSFFIILLTAVFFQNVSGAVQDTSTAKTFGPYGSVKDFQLYNKNYCFIYSNKDDFFTIDTSLGKSYKIEKQYVILNGKKYGPYKNVQCLNPLDEKDVVNNSYYFETNSNDYGFTYTEHGKKYTFLNGALSVEKVDAYTDKKIPVSRQYSIFKIENGYANKGYVMTKEKEYGPFDYLGSVNVLDDKNWGFYYTQDKKDYVFVNNKTYGPYERAFGPEFFGFNQWVFDYTKDNKDFVMINGKEYGPFDSTSSVHIMTDNVFSDHMGFSYTKDKKAYTFIDGRTYGPYEQTFYPHLIGKNWAFSYVQNGKAYVNINGKEYGPYDFKKLNHAEYSYHSPDPVLSGDHWGFDYYQGNKAYVMVDGKIYGPYDEADAFQFIGKEKSDWISKIKRGKDFFYLFNGKEYLSWLGDEHDSDPFYATYKDYAFNFLSLKSPEGIRNRVYAIINGKKYGPFYDTGRTRFFKDSWGFIYGKDIEKTTDGISIPQSRYILFDGAQGEKIYGPYQSMSHYFQASENLIGFGYRTREYNTNSTGKKELISQEYVVIDNVRHTAVPLTF